MPVSSAPTELGRALDAQLGWLFARQRFGVKLGLERVQGLLERLGHPEKTFEVVLVGGTNGKGSCAATLAAILGVAGRRTGLFTSPHLTHFSERFQVDGAPVSAAELLAGLGAVRPHAEALEATFFEIVTALGCFLFAQQEVEVAVMEVGLGGRFDATNALAPSLSVITGVALDHTEVLGDTLSKIAAEKAGIMRPGTLTITGAMDEALDVLRETARKLNAPLWVLGKEIRLTATDLGWSGAECTVESPLGTVQVTTPLLGLHQARNVALAVAAAQRLGVSVGAIQAGVSQTRWAGRLEGLPYGDRTFLLDGAHNPQAAAALAAALKPLGAAPVTLIFGAATDKDLTGLVKALAPATSQVIVTRAVLSPRAARPETLAELWAPYALPVYTAETPKGAVEQALEHTPSDAVIVVAGSLYLVGEVRPLLLAEEAEPWVRLQ